MKHYGDITKLSGYDLPVVDIITGGSPCQDLSVAGKRAGLAGERSGLFMEQVRIVKEMRERDARDTGRTGFLVRPRYMVWENVPGAFSSNGGKDFQAVLEEIVRIVEDEVPDLSTVVQGGWTKSGCLYDELGAWSIAWTVHNAAEWGVPQRRLRISLVADFGGLSAPEILFERQGLSWNYEPLGAQREGAAGGAEGGAGGAISFQERAGKPGGGKGILLQHEHVGALSTLNNQACFCLQGNGIDRADTAYTALCINGEVSPSLMASAYKGPGNTQDGMEVLCFDKGMYNCGERMTGEPQARYDSVSPTVRADSHPSGVCTSTVRRLTPLECERLQGYPDGWTDIGEWTDSKGKKHKEADSPRYKALGNSIALPFWAYLARRICAQYERQATMASLFDGIGGFPLCFQRSGAVPVWASEIEEFCVAVTKERFGDK